MGVNHVTYVFLLINDHGGCGLVWIEFGLGWFELVL